MVSDRNQKSRIEFDVLDMFLKVIYAIFRFRYSCAKRQNYVFEILHRKHLSSILNLTT